jgi:hypothetical protein
MLMPYAGYDPTEEQIVPRGPASRFSEEEIATMVCMAAEGASSLEIARHVHAKPEAIRAKLWRLGIRLRKRVARLRVRMQISITARMREAAEARGITPHQLIRRLLRVISKNEFYFDELLPLPVPHSLGAAAVVDRWHNQPPTILRRIELAGSIGTPQLTACLAR